MAIYPLMKRNSLNQLFGDFEREINRIFERGSESTPALESADWLPAIDIQEQAKEFVVHADIPGVEMKDIDVSLEDEKNLLIIKGHRESEKKEDKNGYVRIERAKGSFYRSLTLPNIADVSNINAEYNQGVLTIRIPKREQSVARKIQIQGQQGQQQSGKMNVQQTQEKRAGAK